MTHLAPYFCRNRPGRNKNPGEAILGRDAATCRDGHLAGVGGEFYTVKEVKEVMAKKRCKVLGESNLDKYIYFFMFHPTPAPFFLFSCVSACEGGVKEERSFAVGI